MNVGHIHFPILGRSRFPSTNRSTTNSIKDVGARPDVEAEMHGTESTGGNFV